MGSHDFEFLDVDYIGAGLQDVSFSLSSPDSRVTSSPPLATPVGNAGYLRPHSAPPCPLPDNAGSLSGFPLEGSLRHVTPLVSSQIRFTQENRSVGSTPTSDQGSVLHEESKHIPRPLNAFMLYRSDFLKRRTIPPEVEKRQQNLSCIAGQCWNMLPDDEKAVWHDRAAAVRAAHSEKYPFYKFKPSRKGVERLSTKDKEKFSRSTGRGKDRIQSLREEYTAMVGPSLGPVRRSRARRTRPYTSPYCEGMFAALHAPLPPSESATPTSLSPTSLASASPSFASPSFTSSSPSPLTLPSLLPPFAFHGQSSWRSLPPAASQSLVFQSDTPGSETRESHSSFTKGSKPEKGPSEMVRNLEITPTPTSFYQDQHTINPQHENNFMPYTSYLGLEQLQPPYIDPMSQAQSPSLPNLNPSPLYGPLEGLDSFPGNWSSSGVGRCHSSLVPWYPLSPNMTNSSELSGF